MAIRWKKSRGRRIAFDRTRPISRPSRFADLPPEKGIGRTFVILLFYTATLAVLYLGNPPVDIRPGEIAQKHYISRITFTCEDKDLTAKLQASKRQEQPNVYVSDKELIFPMQNAVVAVLKGSAPAANPSPRLAQLLQEIKPLAEQQMSEAVGNILLRAREAGVIDDEQRRAERQLNRRVLVVLDKPENVTRRVRVDETISLQKELPQFLEGEVQKSFPNLSADAREELRSIVLANFKSPTLKPNAEETAKAQEEAAKTVPAQERKVEEGSVILARGAVATPQDIYILEKEKAEYARSEPAAGRMGRFVGCALIVLLGYIVLGTYIYRYQEALVRSNNRLFMMGALCFAVLAIAKIFAYKAWPSHLVPVPLAGIILTLAYGPQFGLMASFVLVVLVAVVAGNNFGVFLIYMAGSAIAVFQTYNVRNRTRLIHVGFATGLTLCLATWAVGLLEGQKVTRLFWESVMFWDGLLALANGVLVGFVVTGLLPLIERLFGVLTDISLLEWCDQNQPVLRKLVLEAPGTYHHSLVVGNLAEAAAEAIGSNALLARAGAYYHDIGKLNKPEYFVENVGEEHSKHTNLSPTLSSLIITAHTKDGAELADAYDLPEVIRNMILQHHGTTLVEYFYNKAVRQAGDNGNGVEEGIFRYRGPLPRTKEAGIVLLADCVESASRTLSEPTPSRIRAMVQGISKGKLMDSQFVESGLTLTDIHQIEESLIRGLTAIFHSRIRYRPERP